MVTIGFDRSDGRSAFGKLAGLSLYWAWMFISSTTFSTVFGTTYVLGGIPYDALYFCFRVIALFLVVLFSHFLSSAFLTRVLTITAATVGPVATALITLLSASQPLGLVILIGLLVGLTDAALFVIWLNLFCLLGAKGTLTYLAGSYLVGSLISMLIGLFVSPYNIIFTALLPLFGAVAFVYSQRSNADVFDVQDAVDGSETHPSFADEPSRPLSPVIRVLGTFVLISIVFGIFKGVPTVWTFESLAVSTFAQVPLCTLMGVLVVYLTVLKKEPFQVYVLYRFVPIVLVCGCILAFYLRGSMFVVPALAIYTGYNFFELMTYGVMSDFVHRHSLPPLRTIALCRLLNSIGIFIGLVITIALKNAGGALSIQNALLFACIVLTVIGGTLFFSNREIQDIANISHEMTESRLEKSNGGAKERTSVEEACETISGEYKLSPRERDVIVYLARGRNASYISEKLFISVGTVKTHTANIYKKLEIHTQQELLDKIETLVEDGETQDKPHP